MVPLSRILAVGFVEGVCPKPCKLTKKQSIGIHIFFIVLLIYLICFITQGLPNTRGDIRMDIHNSLIAVSLYLDPGQRELNIMGLNSLVHHK